MAIVGPHPWEGLAAKALPIGSGPAKQKTNLPWVDHTTGTRPDTRAPTPAIGIQKTLLGPDKS